MKTANNIVIATILAVAALISGCASTDSRYNALYGVIESIEMTPAGSSGGTGAGAVIGGVVGGVLGHQVGSGRGQDAATAAGAIGGAVVGHQMDKGRKDQYSSHIRVRLDSGAYLTVTQEGTTDLRVGDRVRIENERVTRY